jgi:hypothetical protein
VAGQTTIIGDQHGLVEGQNTVGQDLKALIDVVWSLDKSLMIVVDDQKAMLTAMTVISNQIEKSCGDLNSGLDNVGDPWRHRERDGYRPKPSGRCRPSSRE